MCGFVPADTLWETPSHWLNGWRAWSTNDDEATRLVVQVNKGLAVGCLMAGFVIAAVVTRVLCGTCRRDWQAWSKSFAVLVVACAVQAWWSLSVVADRLLQAQTSGVLRRMCVQAASAAYRVDPDLPQMELLAVMGEDCARFVVNAQEAVLVVCLGVLVAGALLRRCVRARA